MGLCGWAMIKLIIVLESITSCTLLAQGSIFCLRGWFRFCQGMLCSQGLPPEPRHELERTQLESLRSKWTQLKSSFKSMMDSVCSVNLVSIWIFPCYSSTTHHSPPPYWDISTNCCQLISKIYFYLFLRAKMVPL